MPLTREELLTAVEENPEALYKVLAHGTPGAWYERGDRLRLMSFTVPVSFLNGVSVAHFGVEDCEEAIERAIARMQGSGMPWSWALGPTSRPFDLQDRLLNHGMVHSYDQPNMVADLTRFQPKALPPGFEILDVSNDDAYRVWGKIAQTSFGLPDSVFTVLRCGQCAIGYAEDAPLRNFVGLADGEPVCTGSVFYAAGVAGIYTIGTPPVHRGNGYGTAITLACMEDAKRRGHEIAFLQASRMGYSVYEKIGFVEICKIPVLTMEE